MSRAIRVPAGFRSWSDYGDTYGVDVIPDVWVMVCRQCGSEWQMHHNNGKLARQMHRGCPNECNGPRKVPKSTGTLPPMLDRRLDELLDWHGVRTNADERNKYSRPPARDGSGDDERRRRTRERRHAAKREQREWFKKVQAGWRPPTAEQRARHVERQIHFLEEVNTFPDPMRVIFAQEGQPGRDLDAFLERWRQREDWS